MKQLRSFALVLAIVTTLYLVFRYIIRLIESDLSIWVFYSLLFSLIASYIVFFTCYSRRCAFHRLPHKSSMALVISGFCIVLFVVFANFIINLCLRNGHVGYELLTIIQNILYIVEIVAYILIGIGFLRHADCFKTSSFLRTASFISGIALIAGELFSVIYVVGSSFILDSIVKSPDGYRSIYVLYSLFISTLLYLPMVIFFFAFASHKDKDYREEQCPWPMPGDIA